MWPEPVGRKGARSSGSSALSKTSSHSASDIPAQLLQGGGGRLGCGIADREIQPSSQFGEGKGYLQRLLGVDPPDQPVVGLEAMGIFQGYLCLAHTAQPVDGPGQNDGGAVSAQFVVKSVQDAPAPGEVGVAVRNVPDPRHHGRGADGVRIPPPARGSILFRPRRSQLPQGVEHLEFQVVPRGKGTDDQARAPQPLAEPPSPGHCRRHEDPAGRPSHPAGRPAAAARPHSPPGIPVRCKRCPHRARSTRTGTRSRLRRSRIRGPAAGSNQPGCHPGPRNAAYRPGPCRPG